MERQRIEDRDINIVKVALDTEKGCDPQENEYSLRILSVLGCLDISSIGGVDDVSLIKDCIENDIDWEIIPEEGATFITLEESGEWEDVFWHKYYKIIRTVTYPL